MRHALVFKAIILRGPQREYSGTRLLNLDGLLEVHVQAFLKFQFLHAYYRFSVVFKGVL